MFLFDLFNKNNAIFKAVKSNDVAKLQECIQQGISVNYAKSNGMTPLMYAAKIGNLQMVQHLLGIGADANCMNKNNVNALAYAATNGHLAIVEYLAPKTADLNTAMWKAICNDHVAIAGYLINNGINVNTFVQPHQVTFLHKACEHGNLEIVKLLIEAGADINIPSKDQNEYKGATPLMYAVSFLNADIVEYLVEHGADVNAKADGVSVLEWAETDPETKPIADYLKSKGATY